MLLAFPWLFVPFALYNLVAFTAADPGAPQQYFGRTIANVQMISGAIWTMTLADILIVVTLILLFVEIVKATRTTAVSTIDHGFSAVLFAVCLIEFILRKEGATSLFFFITLVTFIDVIAGFSLSIKAARRDLAFDR